jgi:hypothetical protein
MRICKELVALVSYPRLKDEDTNAFKKKGRVKILLRI